MQKTISICLAAVVTLTSSLDIRNRQRYVEVYAFDGNLAGILDIHECRLKIEEYMIERYDAEFSPDEWVDMDDVIDFLSEKSIDNFRLSLVLNHTLDQKDKCK